MIVGLSVTKSMTWRGIEQEFSNVYHYKSAGIDVLGWNGCVDAVVAAERALFSSQVAFKGARVWGPADASPADNDTLLIKTLSGYGTALSDAEMYREAALMIKWPLGRYGSRNRPQYLRKFLHTLSLNGMPAAVKSGSTWIASTPAAVTSYIQAVTLPVFDAQLCSKNGYEPTGPGVLHGYLEHRQLGR